MTDDDEYLGKYFLCCFLGLFNMRGADIPDNPLFLAYSIITLNDIR